MGAIAVFARTFRPDTSSGEPAEDFTADDEDVTGFDLSYTRLEKLLTFGEGIGIPRFIWPVYIDKAGTPILPSLEELYLKNQQLRAALIQREQEAQGDELLYRILKELKEGRNLFINH